MIKRIAGIRRQLATELGFVLGPVRVLDNVALKVNEYVISVKGAEFGRYELPSGCDLAIPVGKSGPPPGGEKKWFCLWALRGGRRSASRRSGLAPAYVLSHLRRS